VDRRDPARRPHLSPCAAALILCTLAAASEARADVLEYLGRYNCQEGPDHLMDVLALTDGRAIVSSYLGLTLVDLDALPASGSQDYLFRLPGLDARDVVTPDGQWFYVNLNRTGATGTGGVAIVERTGDALVLHGELSEPGVLYEKPAVSGGLLVVPAHAYGLRVFSLADPAAPVLVGSIETGLCDAWAAALDGTLCHVADGAGGHKRVDLSTPEAPVVLDGEAVDAAAGTCEAVVARGGQVYLAAGGAGVAWHPGGDPAQRVLYPVPGAAEDLALAGDHLVVGSFSGVTVFHIAGDGSLSQVCSETSHRRGAGAHLRLAEGVDALADGRVLVANWKFLDLYRRRATGEAQQPDVDADLQRVRFPATGGTATITLANDGDAPLPVNSIHCAVPAFTVANASLTLAPGESHSFTVAYTPSGGVDQAVLRVNCGDPDEAVLPVQLFGATAAPDPGEPAPDFTLPLWEKDAAGQWGSRAFHLADHHGQVVWFQVYGLW